MGEGHRLAWSKVAEAVAGCRVLHTCVCVCVYCRKLYHVLGLGPINQLIDFHTFW